MPERVPERALAPDGLGEATGNGPGLPPAQLHIAILAPDRQTYDLLRRRAHVIQPPYWPGTVQLHVIVNPDLTVDDATILQAAVDLGWSTPDDAQIGPPAQLALGYETNR